MPLSFAIRPAAPADLEAVAAVFAAADPLGWTLKNLMEGMAAGYRMHLICVQDRIAGCAVVSQVIDETELLEIAVHPDFQGRGLGKALLAHVLAQARANAARCMHLEVRIGNTRARALYEKMGFAVVGQRKAYYRTTNGPREDAVLMRADWAL